MSEIDDEFRARLARILDEESRYAINSDEAIEQINQLLADHTEAVRRGGWGLIGRGR